MADLWDFQEKSVVTVDNKEVHERLRSGKFGLKDEDVDNDGRVRIVTPDGRYGSVPVDNLDWALGKGYRLETHEDAIDAQRQDWAKRRANPIEASLTSFGDIASFGVIPQVMEAVGGEDYRAYRKALETYHPYASGAGKIAGAIVPGAAARGAGGAIAGQLAARGVGRIGQAAGAMAGTGALEGAIYGGAELVTEDALGRADIVSQDILSYVGGGMLLGGGIGAAMGLTGGVLREGARKILGNADEVARVRNEALGEVATNTDGVIDQLHSKGAGFVATLQGKSADVIKKFTDPGRAGRIARQRAQQGADASFRDGAARELSGLIDESMKQFRRVADESVGQLKRANVAGIVNPRNGAAAADDLRGVMRDLLARTDDIVANPGDYAGSLTLRYAKQAKKYLESSLGKLDDIGQRIESGGTADDMADLFILGDQVKRRHGRWSRPGVFLQGADAEGIGGFRNSYERLRQHLERADLYGDAATAQKSINEQWARFLSSEKFFAKNFTTRFGQEGFDPVFQAEPGKVLAFLNRVSGPEGDLARKALDVHVKGQRGLSEAIDRLYPLGDEARDVAAKLRDTGMRTDALVKDAIDKIELANELADITTGGRFATAGRMADAALSMYSGAEDVVGKAWKSAGLGQVAGVTGKVERRINGAVKSIAKWDAATTRSVPAVATSAFFSSPLGPRKRKARDRRQAFQHRSEELTELVADPTAMADRIASNVGELENVAPKLAAATAGLSARVSSYLYEKMPKRPGGGDTLTPLATEWAPSDAEISRFSRYYNAAIDPLSVLDDLESGTLTREAVEAVRTLYPDLHEKITAQIAEAAGTRTEPIPYADRVQLSMLFGIPLDPSMRPDRIAQLQQSVATAPGGQQAPAVPPGHAGGGMRATGLQKVTLGDTMKTRTQRTGDHL